MEPVKPIRTTVDPCNCGHNTPYISDNNCPCGFDHNSITLHAKLKPYQQRSVKKSVKFSCANTAKTSTADTGTCIIQQPTMNADSGASNSHPSGTAPQPVAAVATSTESAAGTSSSVQAPALEEIIDPVRLQQQNQEYLEASTYLIQLQHLTRTEIGSLNLSIRDIRDVFSTFNVEIVERQQARLRGIEVQFGPLLEDVNPQVQVSASGSGNLTGHQQDQSGSTSGNNGNENNAERSTLGNGHPGNWFSQLYRIFGFGTSANDDDVFYDVETGGIIEGGPDSGSSNNGNPDQTENAGVNNPNGEPFIKNFLVFTMEKMALNVVKDQTAVFQKINGILHNLEKDQKKMLDLQKTANAVSHAEEIDLNVWVKAKQKNMELVQKIVATNKDGLSLAALLELLG